MTNKEPISREAWLERRRHGIGGSDIAAILGISPWKTPLNIWMEKTGRVAEQPSTLRMEIGKALEPLAAAEYTNRTGRKVRRCNLLLRGADLPDSPEGDVRVGNVDRLCYCTDGKLPCIPKTGKVVTDRALEIKTSADLQEWDDVPDHYKAQALHYMGLMPSVKVFDFPVIFLTRGTMRTYTVERDDAVIRDMAAAARDFWATYVETDQPPPPVDDADARTLYPKETEGKKAVANAEVEAAIARLRSIAQAIKSLETDRDAATALVQAAMGDAETLVRPDGSKLATWKATKDRSVTDWKTIADILGRDGDPDYVKRIIEENSSVKPGSRCFRISSSSGK